MNVLPDFVPPLFVSVLLMVASGASAAPEAQRAPPPSRSLQLAQVTIEQRVIIRIPMVRPPAPPPPPGGGQRTALAPPVQDDERDAPTLKEVKGPKCLKLQRLRGFVINSETGVTLLTDKDELFRTHVGRMCRAADFYSGFYIQPTKDGDICAGRDALHARNGSTCDIEKFTKLVPDD
jgi:hypothetical protein